MVLTEMRDGFSDFLRHSIGGILISEATDTQPEPIHIFQLSLNIAPYPNERPPAVVDDQRRVLIALAMMGGALGFLPYNRNPASIFMGDAGSMLLGYLCISIILLFAALLAHEEWDVGLFPDRKSRERSFRGE